MSQIYGCATETLIYISHGQTNVSNDEVVDLEKDISRYLEGEYLEQQMHAWLQDGCSPILDTVARALDSGAKEIYWRRIWTVQACAFARSLTLISGGLRLSWSMLLDISEAAAKPWLLLGGDSGGYIVRASRLRNSYLRNRDKLRGDRTELCPLWILTRITESTSCADPRDMIYGLVGLFSAHQKCSGIIVDCMLCTNCVYLDINARIFEDTNSLDALASCQYHEHELALNLVSWVPHHAAQRIRRLVSTCYRLRPATAPIFSYSHNFKELTATGFPIGFVGCIFHGTYPDQPLHFSDWASAFSDWVLFVETHIKGETHSERSMGFEVLIELMTDLEPQDTSYVADLRAFYIDCLGVEALERFPTGPMIPYLIAFMMVVQSGCLFSINQEQGGISLGISSNVNITQGDTICGILGCELPLAIRYDDDRCTILEACAVSGYGNEETVDKTEATRSNLQKFCFS